MKSPQKKKPDANNTHTDTRVSALGWSGPLPPPAALEQFNSIIDNGAERIFKMAEAEQAARQAREAEAAQYEITKLDARQSARPMARVYDCHISRYRRISNRLFWRAPRSINRLGRCPHSWDRQGHH
ncbi:DUF2335 domain-containing protein [Methylomonas sp. MgM2]